MSQIFKNVLETERLLLEQLRPEHAAGMWEVFRDPEIYTWIPRDPPDSVDAIANRFRLLAVGGSKDGREQWLNWTAWRKDTHEPVGLFEVTIQEKRRAAVAYFVRPSLWRQKYATEGMFAVNRALFSAGVKSIEAEIDTRNAASRALLLRLNFALIGKKENADYFKGSRSDEELWRLEAPL